MADFLPSFPCWCQATYSWGGETKKDLGFIEGDLIEALNAGDGSWWMGRLRRDPRAIGLFPSNFVKVLDASFQPAPNSRQSSVQKPAMSRGTKETGSTAFRKPFTAYQKLGPRGSFDTTREGTPESGNENKKEKSKFRPYASMKTTQPPTGTVRRTADTTSPVKVDTRPRIPDPLPRGGSRARHMRNDVSPSPEPSYGYAQNYSHPSRAPSPQPGYVSRPHSPLPASYHDGSAFPQLLPASRQPSPNPYQQQYGSQGPPPVDDDGYGAEYHHFAEADIGSSPPPPPPAHRIAYQPSRPPSRQPSLHDQRQHSITPVPPSPSGGMTPSPLRDAMNDVMSSLQGMGVDQEEDRMDMRDVWGPDTFEVVRSRSRAQSRAHSTLGFRHDQASSRPTSRDDDLNGLPSIPPKSTSGRLDSFVHRMETQLDSPSHTQDRPPQPPLKDNHYSHPHHASSRSMHGAEIRLNQAQQQLRARKSTAEMRGQGGLDRTYTTKTNVTNSTNSSSNTQTSASTQLTSRSIMSGYSASGFSATSAGSLARRKFGLGSQRSLRERNKSTLASRSMVDLSLAARDMAPSEHSGSGPSYHDSHASQEQTYASQSDWNKDAVESSGVLGGMMAPKAKKSGFFRKMIDSAKTTARTGAASARSTLGSRPSSRAGSPTKGVFSTGEPTGFGGGTVSRPGSSYGNAARDMGLSGSIAGGGGGPGAATDWMQVRRDVNRSNSLSKKEREERIERSEMLAKAALSPIDLFNEIVEGDEGLDGLPIPEPTDFNTTNLALVDKSTRFVQSVPPMITVAALAQNYVCRPHRSDVQRLRAIFTWVAERITWEEDFEGQTDSRRVVQTRRGCSEEIAVVVREMCMAVGLHAEIVRGYLKGPGELVDLDTVARGNHWWNAVIVDGEWKIMDCALAGPTHPRRMAYSSASAQVAESWYFLARPTEICYTHLPLLPEQQHVVPPVDHEILMALPMACPSYFRNNTELTNFDTGLLHLENLEMAHIHVTVPEDVECVAETEARAFAQDADGDVFESGDVVRKRVFAQAEWEGGRKRFTIKALLPGDEGQGVLKVYAGKRGLMHSIRDNPHPLAFAVPVTHVGQNPPYDFHIRHPTPHAQRHDLYVAQPQCHKLVMNNTFVFCIRQHPSSLSRFTPDTCAGSSTSNTGGPIRPTSPAPFVRPSSAMSMVSMTTSQSGSNYSDPQSGSGGVMTAAQQKPAKLAIQTPSQKIIRLTRKQDMQQRFEDPGLTTSWETVVKIGEKGTWRGLVLADRSARWCVFAEWECI